MTGSGDPRRENETLRERISTLNAAILRISATLDLDTVLAEAVGSARKFTGARYGAVVTVNETGDAQGLRALRLHGRAGAGVGRLARQRPPVPAGPRPAGATADRRPVGKIAHRILAAGDLNIDCGIDCDWRLHDNLPRSDASCRIVWDRMKALGFEYLGPRYPNGRRADPTPRHLPAETKNVPTQYGRAYQGSPEDARLQLDHVFASHGFHQTIETRALNEVDEWGPSDHARLWIEVGK